MNERRTVKEEKKRSEEKEDMTEFRIAKHVLTHHPFYDNVTGTWI